MKRKYPVITLCGSTRFKEQFLEAQKRLTLEGNIVISVGLFGHSGDDEVWTEGTKEMLDDMHKRKIDMADAIYVINVDGYVGESTRSEIEYARMKRKYVSFLEPTGILQFLYAPSSVAGDIYRYLVDHRVDKEQTLLEVLHTNYGKRVTGCPEAFLEQIWKELQSSARRGHTYTFDFVPGGDRSTGKVYSTPFVFRRIEKKTSHRDPSSASSDRSMTVHNVPGTGTLVKIRDKGIMYGHQDDLLKAMKADGHYLFYEDIKRIK